jgi:Dolichyl-phosphate-mannose-protein mannosyltransferase
VSSDIWHRLPRLLHLNAVRIAPDGGPLSESTAPGRRARVFGGVGLLVGIFWIQLAFSVHRNSFTWDEDDHIYSGYMSWKHGDFGLNPEHPPLVKLVAALPLLHLPVKMPALQNRFFKLEGFLGGKEFFFNNDADGMLFRARLAVSLFAVLLAVLVFLVAKEMFGLWAGFIALGLLAFDPNFLAHGAVVGTDAGLSCFLFASIYAFYRYVKAPSAGRLAAAGLATGLAISTKHTAILVFPMLAMLAVCEIFRRDNTVDSTQRDAKGKRTVRLAAALLLITVISIGVLWAFYGFRYEPRANRLAMNPTYAEFVKSMSRPHDVWLLSTVGRFHLLPESYLYGLADVRKMSDFYRSFVFGKIYPQGVWFYFPVAFAIKSSLAFLILLLLAIWAMATRKFTAWREIRFLTIPPAFYLLVAMVAGMNIGLRHILPMYTFLIVLVGGAAWALIQTNRRWAYAIVVLLIFQAVSTTRTFPAYMAYANELWGGPTQTYKYLTDSNVDWAQQLKATKRYLDDRGVKNCWFVYFGEGVIDYSYYGIPCKPLPTPDAMWTGEFAEAPPAIDGPVLISAGCLSGWEFGPGVLNPYEQFKSLKPAAVIDFGVFVFDGHFEIPLAASLSHSHKAQELLAANQLPEALAEAQQALALAPNAVRPNALLGSIYTAMDQPAEARAHNERALQLAKTVEPGFQRNWITGLEGALSKK